MDDNAVIDLSFASEEPYERWWGIEILEVSAEAVDLARMNDGAAVLVGHRDLVHVGTVVPASAHIRADRKLACQVRFASDDEAQRYRKRVAEGVLSKTSVGYEILEVVEEATGMTGEVSSRRIDAPEAMRCLRRAVEATDGERDVEAFYRELDEVAGKFDRASGVSTFRVTRWRPFEVSLVAIPADPTVGVGRDGVVPMRREFSVNAGQSGKQTMERKMDKDEGKGAPAAGGPDIRVIEGAAREAERQRTLDIMAQGEQTGHVELARQYVQEGKSLDEFRAAVLEKIVTGKGGTLKPAGSEQIGLSRNDVRKFSFRKLLLAVSSPADMNAQREAAFELECAQAARDAAAGRGKRGNEYADKGAMIPVDVLLAGTHEWGRELERAMSTMMRRELTVGTASAAGDLVGTDLRSASFIDMLIAQSRVMSLGATVLSDLSGNLAIPRQTGGATTYWLAESGEPTGSDQAVDQVALAPKTIGAYTDYSRRLLLQSSIAVEAFVRADLTRRVAQGIDVAAINGSGSSNQPTGILNMSGVGSVALGTNGGAPTRDMTIDLESAVANAHADMGALAYLTNSRVRGKLKKTEVSSGTAVYAWGTGRDPRNGVGELNGYDAYVSNNVPNTLTKGTTTGACSAMIFGNWADLLIGMWSGLDVMLDPYALSKSGGQRIVALQDVDIAARHAASFAVCKDIVTT